MLPVLLLLGCPRPTPPAEPVALEPSRLARSQAASWYLRARVAEARGDLDEARRALDWVLRFDRASAWAWLAAARFHLRQAELDRARDALVEARIRGPELWEIELLQARVELAAGHHQAAWERALEGVDDPELGLAAARVAVAAADQACRREAVWQALRAPVATEPAWAAVQLGVAEAVGDDALAAAVRPVVAEGLDDPAEAARAWLGLGAPERAAALFEAAGDAARAGDAWLAAGRPEEALRVTDSVREPTTRWVRVGALEALGRAEEAEVEARQGVDEVDGALRVSRLRALRGDPQGALRALEAVGEPDLPEVLVARAALLDDEAEAEVLRRRAVRVRPELTEAWLGLARAGDPEAAIWVLDLAPCGRVDWLVEVAPLLPPCDGAEALRRAVQARPADPALRERWIEQRDRCGE